MVDSNMVWILMYSDGLQTGSMSGMRPEPYILTLQLAPYRGAFSVSKQTVVIPQPLMTSSVISLNFLLRTKTQFTHNSF